MTKFTQAGTQMNIKELHSKQTNMLHGLCAKVLYIAVTIWDIK